jgi:hypothetical protein
MDSELLQWASYVCVLAGVVLIIESISNGFLYFIVGILLLFFVSEELHKMSHSAHAPGHGH